MRILLVHNRYQHSGGEDSVFAAESRLLRKNEHKVVEYVEDNQRIKKMSRGAVAAHAIWSHATRLRLRKVLHDSHFDVVHFHNTFPLISPSAYSACQEANVPVVQTLHNYRLLCPAANFFRDGRVCEECLRKTPPWPSVLHGCYRESRAQSTIVAAMLSVHRWRKTWQDQVDLYVALTEFSRRKFIEGGLPARKIHVKPNFVDPDPGSRNGNGHYALFAGRLSAEKGVWTMLRAWRSLRGIPLRIAGDGPLMGDVEDFVRTEKMESVEILGRLGPADVTRLMKGARFLVFPSECYETFGLIAIEAFSCGVPVIASDRGAMAEIVETERTGLLFRAGDPGDLAVKVQWAVHHADVLCRMGEDARKIYEQKYTAAKNYNMLLEIYEQAMKATSDQAAP